ncbi:MAG: tetratricopeptide repeat protein, partial [Gemmatimonadota bacterium]
MTEALTTEIEELRLLMGSPRDPHGRVFAQLGDALRRAGFHGEALDVLLDGVAEHPNFSPGHLVLGWTAQEAGDLEVARTAYQRTLELDPDNPNGLFGLGAILDRAGDPQGEALIRRAEDLDRRVREVAPRLPLGAEAPAGVRVSAGDGVPLEGLPFLALSDLAPEPVDSDRERLEDLPFIPLARLAPDPVGAEGGGVAEPALASLPFVSLEELSPDAEDPEQSQAAEEDAVEFGDPVAPSGVREDDEQPGLAESSETADEPSEEDVLGGPLATRTMGELLVRQGLMRQAVEVFEELVRRSPGDEGLQDRLDELRSQLSPTESPGPEEIQLSEGDGPAVVDRGGD